MIWPNNLYEALWVYKTTTRTPTQATPFLLAFVEEAILLLKMQLPSLRGAIHESITKKTNAELRLEELETLDENRLVAQQNLELS